MDMSSYIIILLYIEQTCRRKDTGDSGDRNEAEQFGMALAYLHISHKICCVGKMKIRTVFLYKIVHYCDDRNKIV